jgi:3-isopropylmalate/(R)-2-methylmalate dehydratase small subunit
MEAITRFSSKTVVIASDDIDTDQIIPARYLTTTTKVGLGENLFADWRYDADGRAREEFVLNTSAADGAGILIGGNNFGCGSSREHAPWALVDYGFKAVISTEIADIFRSNALKNGLIPIVVDGDTHAWLIAHPGVEVAVDLEQQSIELPDGRSVRFPIDGFSRYCLMNGLDQLGFLMENQQAIASFEQRAS